jgi:hypothetical protein
MNHRHGNGRNGVIAGAMLAAGAWLATQLGKALGKAIFRYRWQLTPLLVAAPMPMTGWLLALTYWLWPAWTSGAFGVAGVCAVVWVWRGLQRLYDRILAGVVAALVLTWLFAVATKPGTGSLYGMLALGWPLIGIFWWCGGAFKGRVFQDRMRKRWTRILEQAGAAGARVIRHKATEVGEQVTVEMPGDMADDLNKKRVSKARGGRRGTVHIAQDPNNERRLTIHTIDNDPWADGKEQPHPILAVLDDLAKAGGRGHGGLEDAA